MNSEIKTEIKLKVKITGQGCIKCIGGKSNEDCLKISAMAEKQSLRSCVGRYIVYVEDK